MSIKDCSMRQAGPSIDSCAEGFGLNLIAIEIS